MKCYVPATTWFCKCQQSKRPKPPPSHPTSWCNGLRRVVQVCPLHCGSLRPPSSCPRVRIRRTTASRCSGVPPEGPSARPRRSSSSGDVRVLVDHLQASLPAGSGSDALDLPYTAPGSVKRCWEPPLPGLLDGSGITGCRRRGSPQPPGVKNTGRGRWSARRDLCYYRGGDPASPLQRMDRPGLEK